MNTSEIVALCTGIPAIIAAVTALVNSIKAKSTASDARAKAASATMTINAHIAKEQFPIQPATEA